MEGQSDSELVRKGSKVVRRRKGENPSLSSEEIFAKEIGAFTSKIMSRVTEHDSFHAKAKQRRLNAIESEKKETDRKRPKQIEIAELIRAQAFEASRLLATKGLADRKRILTIKQFEVGLTSYEDGYQGGTIAQYQRRGLFLTPSGQIFSFHDIPDTKRFAKGSLLYNDPIQSEGPATDEQLAPIKEIDLSIESLSDQTVVKTWSNLFEELVVLELTRPR